MPIIEFRAPRNLMLAKIFRNLVDIRRLHQLMRNVPTQAMRYHRWSRQDVEQVDSAQTVLIVEMGRLHRGGALPGNLAPDLTTKQDRSAVVEIARVRSSG